MRRTLTNLMIVAVVCGAAVAAWAGVGRAAGPGLLGVPAAPSTVLVVSCAGADGAWRIVSSEADCPADAALRVEAVAFADD